MADNPSVVFCVGDLDMVKHAALFYDSVVPFPTEAFSGAEHEIFTSQQVVQAIWEFIPRDSFEMLLGPISYIMSRPDEFGMHGHKFRATFLMLLLYFEGFARGLAKGKVESTPLSALNASTVFQEFGIEPVMMMPEAVLRNATAEPGDLSLTIHNAQLIRTDAATWEQICEVRKDEEARKKLRNLRLFWQASYANKSRSFIEDDLGKRLDDYHNVVKDYGFETLAAALTVITDSKTLIPLAGAGIAALLFGEPMLASASLVGGVSVELAKVTLELAKKRHSFQKLKRDFDLAYIIDVQKRLDQ